MRPCLPQMFCRTSPEKKQTRAWVIMKINDSTIKTLSSISGVQPVTQLDTE